MSECLFYLSWRPQACSFIKKRNSDTGMLLKKYPASQTDAKKQHYFLIPASNEKRSEREIK